MPLHPQPLNESGWVIFYRLRPLLQAAFRYSAFRFKQWPARSLIAPAPSHRHITYIVLFSIALSSPGLGARSGPGRGRVSGFVGAPTPPKPDTRPLPPPSPCASLRYPIAISPPSPGESGWVIFYRLARRSLRSPRGQAFSRSCLSGACLLWGSPRGLARRKHASVGAYTIAISYPRLGARSGPTLPSPCASLGFPIAISPPSFRLAGAGGLVGRAPSLRLSPPAPASR